MAHRRSALLLIIRTSYNKRACHLYVTDGKPFLYDAVVLFLIDQPIDQVEGLDSIVGCVHARIQGEDDLLVIVLDLLQGSQFPSAGVFACHGLGDLNIELVVGLGGDEVHLSLIHLADGHIVATAEQFEIDHILDGMAAVSVAEAQKVIPQAHVHDIILAQGTQIFFALDIEPLDVIEEIGLQQGVDIGLHRMGAGYALPPVVGQQSLVHQRVADGGNGNGTADIIRQEQDDLPQQNGIGDLPLVPAFLTLQNVPDNDGGVNAVQQHQSLLLIQSHIRNTGHTAEAHIGIKDLPKLVPFAGFVKDLLSGAAQCALGFPDLKIMEVEEFQEGQGEHFDFHGSAGQIGSVFGRKQVGVGAGDINVAVEVHPEGVDGILPTFDSLQFVEEQIHPFAGNDSGFDIVVEVVGGHFFELMGFKVHLDDLVIRDAGFLQVSDHQLQQTGLAAAADAGDDLDGFRIPESDDLFQIQISLLQFMGIDHHTHLLVVRV